MKCQFINLRYLEFVATIIRDIAIQSTLYTHNEISILIDTVYARFEFDGIQMIVFSAGAKISARTAGPGHAVASDVQKCQDPDLAAFANELPETLQCHATGTSGVNDRRHAYRQT